MKRFLLLVVAVVVAMSASAQVLKVGVRGGMTLSSLDFKPTTIGTATVSKNKDSPGFEAALVVRLQIPKFIFISPELVYGIQEYRYTVVPDGGYARKCRVSSKLLTMPVMAGFSIKTLRL